MKNDDKNKLTPLKIAYWKVGLEKFFPEFYHPGEQLLPISSYDSIDMREFLNKLSILAPETQDSITKAIKTVQDWEAKYGKDGDVPLGNILENYPEATTIDPQKLNDLIEDVERRKTKETEIRQKERQRVEQLKKQVRPQSEKETKKQEKVEFIVAPEDDLEAEKRQQLEKAREVFGNPKIAPFVPPQPIQLTEKETVDVYKLVDAIQNNPQTVLFDLSERMKTAVKNAPVSINIDKKVLEAYVPVSARKTIQSIKFLGNQIPIPRPTTLTIIPSTNIPSVLAYKALSLKEPNIAVLAAASETERGVDEYLTSSALGSPKFDQILHGSTQQTQWRELPEGDQDEDISITINDEPLYNFAKEYTAKLKQRSEEIEQRQASPVDLLQQIDWGKIFKDISLSEIRSFPESIFSEIVPSRIVPMMSMSLGAMQGYEIASQFMFSNTKAQLLLQAGMPSLSAGFSTQTALITTPVEYVSSTGLTQAIIMPGEAGIFGASTVGAVDVTTSVGAKLATQAVTTAATETAITVATAEGGTAAAAAAGTAILPIVGTVVGAVIGFVAGKIVAPLLSKLQIWIKKHKEDIAIALALPLVAGILTGNVFLIVGSGIPLGALSLAGGTAGISSGLGGLLGNLSAGIGWVMATALKEIGKPILISLLTFPLLVGFIMLVINNSAYVVPTGELLSGRGSGSGGNVTATSCFVPENNGATCQDCNNWTNTRWALFLKAANYLIQKHPVYVNKVCSSGNIYVRNISLYSGDTANEPNENKVHGLYQGPHAFSGDNTARITLFDVVFSYTGADNWTPPLFTFTHETGHHLNTINYNLYLQFDDQVYCQPGNPNDIPRQTCDPEVLNTYRFANQDPKGEDFAETAAWYVMYILNPNTITYDFFQQNNLYEQHYIFAKGKMFEE